jgi:shikimate dehydrogenase
MAQKVTGHTQLLGFFGSPAAHSTSPAMHNEAFEQLGLDYSYMAFDIGLDKIEDAVKTIHTFGMKGANVSMPCKTAVMKYLDAIDPAAQLCEAVNTIVVQEDGTLKGYSTDGVGYMNSLRDNGVDIIGKKITLAGCGGAGKAIAVQAALDGVKEISIFNVRDSFWGRCEQTVKDIEDNTNCKVNLFELNTADEACMANLKQEIADSVLFANATGVGMGKLKGQTYIPDPSYFRPDLIVTDTIYSPAETAMLKMANEVGCKTINGLGMLFFQGAAAFELWMGQPMPIEHMKKFMGL